MPVDSTSIHPEESTPINGLDLYDRNDFAGAEAAFRAAITRNPDDFTALAGLGTSLIQLGRASEALPFFNKAISLSQPGSAQWQYALYISANALRQTGDLEQAETKATELVQISPDYADGWHLLGLIEYEIGLARREKNDSSGADAALQRAAAAFRSALKADPKGIPSADKLVDTLFETKQVDDLLSALARLNDLQKAANQPDRRRTLRNWIIVLRDQSDRRDLDDATKKVLLDKAVAKATELVTDFPDFAPGWNTRGTILEKAGDPDGAISAYRKALETGKDAASADRVKWLSNLGDALRKQGRHDDAAWVYRERIAIEPDNPAAKNALGLALAPDHPDDAIREYEQAARLWAGSPDRKYALRNWATVLAGQKKPEQSLAKLREALDADPKDADTHNQLGNAVAQSDPEQAIREYEQAARLWAGSSDRKYALRNWAGVLTGQKRPDLALPKLREALAADKNDRDTLANLGNVLAQLSDADAMQEAARLWPQPDSPAGICALRFWADGLNLLRDYQGAADKCRKALQVPGNPEEPWLHLALGRALAGQGDEKGAFNEFEQAGKLMPASDPNGREILWAFGDALLQRERFDESLAVYKRAVDLSPPQDAYFGYFFYGCALYAAGDPNGALGQYEEAIARDETHPFAHNNKADILFRLGQYEKGWEAWTKARSCYEQILEPGKAGPNVREDLIELAVYFADALREVFADYDQSLSWYDRVLEVRPEHTAALCGRAILFRRMQRSSPSVAIQLRGNQAMRDACERLDRARVRPDRFRFLMVLADMCIENQDWQRLGLTLNLADSECKGMRLRRVDILVRRGILSLATDKPEDATQSFEQALIDRAGDLRLMANHGLALLNAKRYESALEAFRQVLDLAPGNVDALIGSARTAIELADDGDADQYDLARKFLTQSLKYGREKGSTRLRKVDIADIYYMRGYAKAKRCEADRGLSPILLAPSLYDFSQARKNNPGHSAAQSSFNKVAQRIRRRARESATDAVGTVLVSVAAAIVFCFAQIDFFLRGTRLHSALAMPATPLLEKPGYYATVTFCSLAIMIAGLSLGKLLKLKVAGIELEKSSADPAAPAAVLNIGRFGLFESFNSASLQGLGATPGDLSGPGAKTAPSVPDKVSDPRTPNGDAP